MKAWSIIAERLNALPCMRAKLKEPLTASDCCQILIAMEQLKNELDRINKQGISNG